MPRSALPFLALLLPVLMAAACTTVPPEQRAAACRATDWHNYGYNDGLLGVPEAERTARFADCAKLGQPADTAAYRAGRELGLAKYCTVENGYDVGYAGRSYRNVCPPALVQGFLQGFQQGRKERPIDVYPSVGFGVGFGYYPFWYGGHRYYRGHHGHKPPPPKDSE